MSFTQEEQRSINSSNKNAKEKYSSITDRGLEINQDNPYAQQDYALIVKAFEVEASNWQRSDYNKVHHYRDIYSTRNFSYRVREQMNYYPGMHQIPAGAPTQDPLYTNAKMMADNRLGFWDNALTHPAGFMNGLRQNQEDFDYSTIFGSDVSAEERAKEIGKMLTECVPCFDRLLDGMELLPDADLLEIHALNLKIRTDILDKIQNLFRDPGMYIDICELLNLLSHLCPQDLLALLALLTQYLAKLNLDFRVNLDFIIQLVGPILSPFLDALSEWLDKWIQLILGPMICVLDHINETILIAQSIEIPLSDVTANASMDLGVAAPAHKNSAGAIGAGVDKGKEGYRAAWAGWQWEQFNTPDEEKYNPTVPSPPQEETELALLEMQEAWADKELSEIERAEREMRWAELRERSRLEQNYIAPPDRPERRDGTRWSKDDIPNSEKYKTGDSWELGYYPSEKQPKPAQGVDYFVTTPLVESIVQLRNILQGGIQYIKDWFSYVTQMTYDLLGTDYGWMTKKIDNTMLKARILEVISLVRAIIQAAQKNGLECGTHSNFNQAQLKYIVEDALNSFSTSKFEVQDDGSILLKPEGYVPGSDADVVTYEDVEQVGLSDTTVRGLTPESRIQEPKKASMQQETSQSAILIKDCFKNVAQEELNRARAWIADFEKRGSA